MSPRSIAALAPDDEGFLAQAAAEVHDHLAASSSSDIRHRYAVGQVVNRVRGSAAFGDAGVKLLAKSVHVDAKTLYVYGKVAVAFTIEDISSAEAAAGTSGIILQFSMLSELVAVADDERRRMLLQKAITSRWTVRQLRQEISEAPDSTRRPRKEKSRAQLTAQVKRLAAEIERRVEQADSQDDWGPTHLNEHEEVVAAFNSFNMATLRYIERLAFGNPQEENHAQDHEARSA